MQDHHDLDEKFTKYVDELSTQNICSDYRTLPCPDYRTYEGQGHEQKVDAYKELKKPVVTEGGEKSEHEEVVGMKEACHRRSKLS